jgi:hypothetical protein
LSGKPPDEDVSKAILKIIHVSICKHVFLNAKSRSRYDTKIIILRLCAIVTLRSKIKYTIPDLKFINSGKFTWTFETSSIQNKDKYLMYCKMVNARLNQNILYQKIRIIKLQ